MSRSVPFDRPTAIKIAQRLEQAGDREGASRAWFALCVEDPYDMAARGRFAETYFELRQAAYPRGSAARSRLILNIINVSLPTPMLAAAYFENLNGLLRRRSKRARPGAVVVGLAAGRCGSSTLTADSRRHKQNRVY